MLNEPDLIEERSFYCKSSDSVKLSACNVDLNHTLQKVQKFVTVMFLHFSSCLRISESRKRLYRRRILQSQHRDVMLEAYSYCAQGSFSTGRRNRQKPYSKSTS